jgi:hypothetical protein
VTWFFKDETLNMAKGLKERGVFQGSWIANNNTVTV